jgi:peroxiredoxin
MALAAVGAKKMTNDARAWLIQQMKGLIVIGVVSLLLAICVNAFRKDRIPWVDWRRAVRAGDVLPHLPVYPAEDPIRWRYLGLPSNQKVVPLADAQADLLVMELLNVYCYYCRSQVLAFNHVFELIEKVPELKGRIKIVGFAVGNTDEEAEDFRKEYGLKFPVIADVDRHAPQLLGPDVLPPFSLYIRRDGTGKLTAVKATQVGLEENPQVLFDRLIELLALYPNADCLRYFF